MPACSIQDIGKQLHLSLLALACPSPNWSPLCLLTHLGGSAFRSFLLLSEAHLSPLILGNSLRGP